VKENRQSVSAYQEARSVKAKRYITSPGQCTEVLRAIYRRAVLALTAGNIPSITFDDGDGPNAKMRNKFHAMCDDIARSVPAFKGEAMSKLKWKAVIIGAHIAQEWLPGIDGHAVPYYRSSEELTSEDYAGLIDVAQMVGDSMAVAWSPANSGAHHAAR
jgi:hypothetical protein